MKMTPNTQQLRSVRSISRSYPVSRPELNRKSMEGAETMCCPATAPKPEEPGEDLFGGVG